MMRLWLNTHDKTPAIRSSAVLSVATHAVLIGAAAAVTAHRVTLVKEPAIRPPIYLIPGDRIAGHHGQSDRLKFVALTGTGSTIFPRADKPVERTVAPPAADRGEQAIPAPEVKPLAGTDSVLSVLDVDTAATRYINTAAPAYPPDLAAQHVEGVVSAQYMVDTTGYADLASLKILSASHPQFVAAVREALPFMRFHPAKIGDHKVRQWVAQDFTFRIQKPQADSARGGGRGSG